MKGYFGKMAVIGLFLAFSGCGGGQNRDDVAVNDAVADVPDALDVTEPEDVVADVRDVQDMAQPEDAVADVSDTQDTTEPEDVEAPTPHGRILLAVMKWGSGEYNDTVQADIGFYDGPMRMDAFAAYSPGRYEAVMRDGACVTYMATMAACEPACNWDQYCNPYSKCVDAPEKISAGTVLLLLGATSHQVEPTGDPVKNYYYVEGIASALIHGGNSLIASAEGVAGGFGAFELQTTGIDPVEFSVDADQGTLTLVDDKDTIVTWTVPKGDTTGLFVDMVINKGWHGAPPEVVMYCRAPASAGSLTITKEMAYGLPPIGGMGLF